MRVQDGSKNVGEDSPLIRSSELSTRVQNDQKVSRVSRRLQKSSKLFMKVQECPKVFRRVPKVFRKFFGRCNPQHKGQITTSQPPHQLWVTEPH